MTEVYLSLGSNIGDKKAYLLAVLERLERLAQTPVTSVSSFYEAIAWGKIDQDDSLNSCCELETDLTPQELLLACQSIEKELKCVRYEHWGPRTVDIDILLYGNKTVATENLSVPHPYMTERAFVLIPLEEIAPQLQFNGQSVSSYLAHLNVQEVRKLLV